MLSLVFLLVPAYNTCQIMGTVGAVMTQSEQVVLYLVRKALFGTEELFPPNIEWKDVFQEAQVQSVVGLTAKVLPDDMPLSIKSEWETLALSQLKDAIRNWNAQDALHLLLTQNGIPYVILKGAAAAMLYPNPFSRAMGDIDFLVPPEHFEQTKALLAENGYQTNHEDSDRHIAYSKKGVSYELHYKFSYRDLDIENILQAMIPHAELHETGGHSFYTLPTRENGLVLLAHLWNHLHTGIGLRQVIDWMMYVHTYVTDVFWNTQFSNLAEQVGLKKTAITATRMCQKYFLLPDQITWCASADESLADKMMKMVVEYGNFGRKQVNQGEAERKAKTALSGASRIGLFRQLQNRGEVNWKAYHKHHWLKPFAWLYQLFRYAVLWLIKPKKQKLSSILRQQSETNDLFEQLK